MRTLLTVILVGTFYTTPLSAQEFQGTMKDIQDSGKIKIGYRQSLPPMSFLSIDGIPSRYSIDLCNSLAAEVKNKIGKDVSIEYVPRYLLIDFYDAGQSLNRARSIERYNPSKLVLPPVCSTLHILRCQLPLSEHMNYLNAIHL